MPICLGYFAVSFAFGIKAASIGLTSGNATLLSLLNMTSAGQLAALDVIRQNGTYLEMMLLELVVNMRYLLMSASLSQNIDPKLSTGKRLAMSYCITDEVFSLSAIDKKPLSPFYTFGLMTVAVLGWCSGTFLGAFAGNILPERIILALGVAIYGMFLAIIIPEGKKNKAVAISIACAMGLSVVFTYAPYLKNLASGNRLIIVTIIVAMAAAILAPIDKEEES